MYLYPYLSNETITQEAISFQKPLLFNGISDLIRQLRSTALNFNEFKAKISSLIEEHTNLKTKISFYNQTNAFVTPPTFDKNNPLMWSRVPKDFKIDIPGLDTHAKLLKSKTEYERIGWVNLKEGKVYGTFAQFEYLMTIGKPLLKSDKFEPEEAAGIILHETGHLFTMCSFVGKFAADNFALMSLAENMLGTSDKAQRIVFLKDNKDVKELGFTDDELETIASLNKPEALVPIYLNAKKRGSAHSGLNSWIYDATGAEFVADQFASRHGAGLHTIKALNKIYKQHGTGDYSGFFVRSIYWIAGILFSFLALTFTHMFASICFILIILIGTVLPLWFNVYDEPTDRFIRIKNDMILQLKDKDLDPEIAKAVVQDIEEIDVLMADMKPYMSFITWALKTLIPSQRFQYTMKNTQQDLERIGANDFFVLQHKLQHL